ncbi:stearoyl-CoA desaturase 5-like [Uranotaenia lowii]|nr:stearoyl-CoA desaturase 5-like [Uranotaenia lowii]
MTTDLFNSLQFIGGNAGAKMGKGKAIINDLNNNETIMHDDRNISEQDVNAYLQHYNKWTQSALGHRLTAILKDWFGYEFDAEIKWNNVFMIGIFHVFGIYGFLAYSWRASLVAWAWGLFVGGCAGFGVTAGVHRLWCHRAYKAKLPLRIILMCCYSIAGQNTIYDWVRDHRIHHKYSETDGDPHNSNRGFLYAHVGWLMLRKHPECIKKGRLIDMTDITSDPVVQFHHR